MEDYHTVAKYFENKGYEIWAVVGHSRGKNMIWDVYMQLYSFMIGSTAGLKYATTCQKPLAHFVNVSGRYMMNDPQIFRNRPHFFEELDKKVNVMLQVQYNILNYWINRAISSGRHVVEISISH